MDMYTLPCLNWTMHNGLLCSTWNSPQCCDSLDGREFGGELMHEYVRLGPFAAHLKLSQHCSHCIPQYKIKRFCLNASRKIHKNNH